MKSHHMFKRSRILLLGCALVCLLTTVRVLPGAHATAAAVPARLSDDQFWKLSTTMSEQDGAFRSDNLLSNELNFQWVIPELLQTARQGRVYMGVGPVQNFIS